MLDMPTKPLEPSEIEKVATLYHHNLMDVQGIATELGIDRRRVDAALLEAWCQGLISIGRASKVDDSLEKNLRKRFPKLLRVEIVRAPPITTSQQYASLLRTWGRYAARYFEELAAAATDRARLAEKAKQPVPKLRVGISGGETLFEFVNAVPERSRPEIEIHATALVGRGFLLSSGSHIDPIVNATLLYSKCGRHGNSCLYATVPPHREDLGDNWTTIREEVDKELSNLAERFAIKQAIKAMDDLDVAFAGLGLVKPDAGDPAHLNRLTMMSLLKPLSKKIPDYLHGKKAIGDIAYALFDKDGVTEPDWRFFLTAGHYDKSRIFSDAGFYKKMVGRNKPVIVMAGTYKELAVFTALKAELFNVWFTNEEAARQIIAMDDAARKQA
jgi:DNA-binding transcriptional regulator LsrR (DeoR family)